MPTLGQSEVLFFKVSPAYPLKQLQVFKILIMFLHCKNYKMNNFDIHLKCKCGHLRALSLEASFKGVVKLDQNMC